MHQSPRLAHIYATKTSSPSYPQHTTRPPYPPRPPEPTHTKLFETLTSTTPPVTSPPHPNSLTTRYPLLTRSSLTQAHPAKSSLLANSSSLTVNRKNASSGTTPLTLPKRSASPLKSGFTPRPVEVRALYSPSGSESEAGAWCSSGEEVWISTFT